MSAEVFLDTNIFVYCFDGESAEKQIKAKKIVSSLGWFVSWQVIQEFSSVALHRFKVPIKPPDLADYVEFRMWPCCRVLPTQTIFHKAIEIQGRFGFRFYDSLIVASALGGGAGILLTEDLQDGQRIGSLEIRNPFRDLA